MKSGYITNRILIGIVLLSLVLLPGLSMATDVGGLINTDTTWNLAGSPYIVIENTLVASGARLTIEPGVQVRFNGLYRLNIEGNIQAKGSFNNEILFTSNTLSPNRGDWEGIQIINNTGSELSWAIVEYTSTAVTVSGGTGNKINNCIIRHSYHTALLLDGADLMVNNNYIHDSGRGAQVADYDTIYLMNNTFENLDYWGINISNDNPVINHNNFLNISGYSVMAYPSTNGIIDGRYNYWGPTTTSEMNFKGSGADIERIHDFYDDLQQARVEYDNWLSAPNPEAYPNPNAPPPDFLPVANAGADKVVFDTVILDGSASYDLEGRIDSYQWTLKDRDNPANDRTSEGVNPTVSNLQPGFYDVTLIVTDNGGFKDTDTMFLAAAGQCVTFPPDRMPPTGAVHAYRNILWPANNKMVTVTLEGYVKDELSIARDGGGVGVSSAYLLINENETIPLNLNGQGRFSVTVEMKAKKGAVYKVKLHATDTNPVGSGGPNSGLVDSTVIRVNN